MLASDARIELMSYFESGKTLDVKARIENLKKLKRVILVNEKRILRCLTLDLKKPSFEGYITEVGQCLEEIDYMVTHLKTWTAPQHVPLPLYHMPAEAFVLARPFGKVLIMGAWNYPFYLLMMPIIGALAAGNVVLAKPSEHAPETSKVIREIMSENFSLGLIHVMEGGVDVSNSLLELQWDHIFFTGSPSVGKIVMKKAAEHLTPVTLELGGKNPAWIDATAPLETSLRRLLWGKFVNAGQTCIAPDYLIIHQSHWPKLKNTAAKILQSFYGNSALNSPDYTRIVNDKHVERLTQLMKFGEVLIGGEVQPAQKYIAPTLLTNVKLDSPLMREEIFGPLLPVFEYAKEAEVYDILKQNPKPLAFYLFSEDKRLHKKMTEQLEFGGGCINDCLMHWGINGLPAGGVGSSGLGSYHGKKSFENFSHSKSILNKWSWPDPKFRYPPYGSKLSLLKKIIR